MQRCEEAYLKIRTGNSPDGYAVTGDSGHGQTALVTCDVSWLGETAGHDPIAGRV
jgi:hypothetical protein